MSRLKQLIHEIHRRSLWQALGVYLAGSWVVLQAVETLADSVGLPDWFPPVAFGLLLVGLPIVVATAFVQEGVGSKGRGREASGEAVRAGRNPASRADSGPSGTPSPGSSDFGVSEVQARPRHGLFTWRNALLGGVGAFALLGLLTAGYMAMRTLGIGPAGTLVARGLIEEGERVILADFENLTRDSLLGEVVTETFRVDPAQTPVVSLAESAYVADVLGRMERPADARLDAEVAREIAIREGIQAVIAGEVGRRAAPTCSRPAC